MAYAKALSLTRPYGWALLHAQKNVENRLWRTNYRGPLILHSAQGFDTDGLDLIERLCPDLPIPAAFPVGYIGVVDLVDVHRGASPYEINVDGCDCRWGFPEQWHWEITRPRPFPGVQAGRGKPGVYDPPTVVIDYARMLGLL